jgi:hypothetical protein
LGPGPIAGIVIAFVVILIMVVLVRLQRQTIALLMANKRMKRKCHFECCGCIYKSETGPAVPAGPTKPELSDSLSALPPVVPLPDPNISLQPNTAYQSNSAYQPSIKASNTAEITLYRNLDDKMMFENPTYEAYEDKITEIQTDDGDGIGVGLLDKNSMKKLGSGNFGTVFSGVLVMSGKKHTVAAKTLTGGTV